MAKKRISRKGVWSHVRTLIDMKEEGLDWRKTATETGKTYGFLNDWPSTKAILTALREEGYPEIANAFQAGVKAGADQARGSSRDPRRKKPKTKRMGQEELEALPEA